MSGLTEQEAEVCAEIARREDELVTLVSDLIGFDTTARAGLNDPPRDEAALQEYLAARMRSIGAEVDLWEPDLGDLAANRQVPPGMTFGGRPQLVARLPGSGGGRSLLFNGHVDVVSSEPRDCWASDPNRAEVREGLLYGRGSCDMKGGVAAMVFATEVLAGCGVRLAGDLLVSTVTEEEATGAGSIASIAHGVCADAGLVPEPTGFDVWIAFRGALYPTITVPGRTGHAEIPAKPWQEGGAVNAIEKMTYVLGALRRLKQEWSQRPDHRHPYLSPGDIVPTLIKGGEWTVSHPSSCSVTFDITYMPGHADADGWGTPIEREIEDWVERAAKADPWLAENPPRVEWSVDIPSAEVDEDEPIVQLALEVGRALGLEPVLGGFDTWSDAAAFSSLGGTPSVNFGPRHIQWAHSIDEYVPVEDLVTCAQGYAVAAMRFCGTEEAD